MARPGLRVLTLAVALMLAVAAHAQAGDEVRRRGSCSGGSGHWAVRVRRHDGTLRVRFRIDDLAPGRSWQLFLSDNGRRVYSGTKTSNAEGEVRVSRRTTNRAGSDRIAASGVGSRDGTTCEGSLTV